MELMQLAHYTTAKTIHEISLAYTLNAIVKGDIPKVEETKKEEEKSETQSVEKGEEILHEPDA